MNAFKAILMTGVVVIGAGCAFGEEGHFQPSKGKSIAQTLQESKKEHNANVSEMRAQLPRLKKQLAEEKKVSKREAIINSLGRGKGTRRLFEVSAVTS